MRLRNPFQALAGLVLSVGIATAPVNAHAQTGTPLDLVLAPVVSLLCTVLAPVAAQDPTGQLATFCPGGGGDTPGAPGVPGLPALPGGDGGAPSPAVLCGFAPQEPSGVACQICGAIGSACPGGGDGGGAPSVPGIPGAPGGGTPGPETVIAAICSALAPVGAQDPTGQFAANCGGDDGGGGGGAPGIPGGAPSPAALCGIASQDPTGVACQLCSTAGSPCAGDGDGGGSPAQLAALCAMAPQDPTGAACMICDQAGAACPADGGGGGAPSVPGIPGAPGGGGTPGPEAVVGALCPILAMVPMIESEPTGQYAANCLTGGGDGGGGGAPGVPGGAPSPQALCDLGSQDPSGLACMVCDAGGFSCPAGGGGGGATPGPETVIAALCPILAMVPMIDSEPTGQYAANCLSNPTVGGSAGSDPNFSPFQSNVNASAMALGVLSVFGVAALWRRRRK